MSFSLNGLIRGFIYLTVVTSLTAIGIHRLAPRPSHFRILKRTGIVPVNGYHFRTIDRIPRIFDPETGRLTSVRMDGVDSFDSATCSPWENDQGQSDVVGRWLGRSSATGVCQGCGLARYQFPGGQFLDRVELDVMPVSRPCFDPDRPSSVLFAAGDGRLYRYTFQGAVASPRSESKEARPVPLTWKTSTAGIIPVAINDPIWPTDPRLKGRLIASLTFPAKTSDGAATMENWLGWLQLNREGTEVIRSGRLIEHDVTTTGGHRLDETLPTLHSAEAGSGLKLAYLTHTEGEPGWTLCAAPLKLDCESGIPVVEASQIRRVAANRSHAMPIFSADGQTLYSVLNSDPKPETIERNFVPDWVPLPVDSLVEQDDRAGRLVKN